MTKPKLTPKEWEALTKRLRSDPEFAKEYFAKETQLREERAEQFQRKRQEDIRHSVEHHKAIKEMDDHVASAVQIAHQHGLMKDLREIWKAYTGKEEKEED